MLVPLSLRVSSANEGNGAVEAGLKATAVLPACHAVSVLVPLTASSANSAITASSANSAITASSANGAVDAGAQGHGRLLGPPGPAGNDPDGWPDGWRSPMRKRLSVSTVETTGLVSHVGRGRVAS